MTIQSKKSLASQNGRKESMDGGLVCLRGRRVFPVLGMGLAGENSACLALEDPRTRENIVSFYVGA